MRHRWSRLVAEYPRQFWILFGGTLINSIGSGMVFPFLTLYLNQRLALSLTMVGLMLTLWSGSSLIGQVLGGVLSDRLGRKRLMVLSLGTSALALVAFGLAESLWSMVIILLGLGLFNAMYQPARDAMVADLVEPERRTQAYGLIRIISNLGISIGPAIGGFLATRSYLLAFLLSAAATFAYFLIAWLLMQETRPPHLPQTSGISPPRPASMLTVLRDVRFVAFCAAAAVTTIAWSPMMTLLPVYMKGQFGLGESYFGWVMTTNALMVVLLQYPITHATRRFARLPLVALGSVLYGLGVGSVTLANEFFHFVGAMSIMTLGEMLVSPNATAYAADLAPAHLRGSYMGVLGLTWSLGFGTGPLIGGMVSDSISPRALWPMMGTVAIAVSLVYLALARGSRVRAPEPVDAA